MKKFFTGIGIILSLGAFSQDFYFGHDLSYVNQMEDCGAVFKENGVPKDIYQIFADHGTNLVRARLWVDPSWWQDSLVQPGGVKPHYNDYEDVKETFRRAREAGMKIMLGFHYSDFWADPGRQLIPRSWLNVAYSLEDLKDSVYNYTVRVLTGLESEGLMPDFVKIGNENNGGILRHIPEENGYNPVASVSTSWSRHAQLFNAGIEAVRHVGVTSSIDPKIVIHFSNQLSGQIWNYNNIINNGVTDFDIIGISYYYAWHGASISELESTIRNLVQTFPAYEVMVVETGYLWTTENFDSNGNIIDEPDPQYLPVIPEKQLEYMVDYTRAVMRAGGKGVVFWEPAWVSTPCRTPWGVGSSHDHVVFFDPVNTNFMSNGGGIWCHPEHYENPNDKKVTFKVNMSGADVSAGVYIAGSWSGSPPIIEPMAYEGNNIYSYFTYLPAESEGSFFFLNDTTLESIEPLPDSCRNQDNGRDYQVGLKNKVYTCEWGKCGPPPPPEKVSVTFKVKMDEDADLSRGVYIVGKICDWEITRMISEGDRIFSIKFSLPPGEDTLAYYYLTTSTWTYYKDYRESVPEECAWKWGIDRGIIVPPKDTTVAHYWGSCNSIGTSTRNNQVDVKKNDSFLIFPIPARNEIYLKLPDHLHHAIISVFDMTGKKVEVPLISSSNSEYCLHTQGLAKGFYILRVQQGEFYISRKLVIR